MTSYQCQKMNKELAPFHAIFYLEIEVINELDLSTFSKMLVVYD